MADGWGDLLKGKFKQVIDKSTGLPIMVSVDAPEYDLDAQGNIVGGLPDKDGADPKPAAPTGFTFGNSSAPAGGSAPFTFGAAPAGGAAPGGFSFGGGSGGTSGAPTGFNFGGGPSAGGGGGKFSFGVKDQGNGGALKRKSDEPAAPRVKRKAIPRSGQDPGEVLIAGNGDCGQMGLGEDGVRECVKPTLIPDLSQAKAIAVCCGGMHTVVVTSAGQVWTWGCNDDAALGRDGDETLPGLVQGPMAHQRVTAVCAGDSHTAALLDDGRVFSWGTYKDSNGIIGYAPNGSGGAVKKAEAPVLVKELQGVHITSIASGSNHTLAVARGSTELFAWGCGEQGQLGRTVEKKENIAALVPRRPGLVVGGAAGGGSLRVLNANFLTHLEALHKADPSGDWTDAMDEFLAHRRSVGAGGSGVGGVGGSQGGGVEMEAVAAGSYCSFAIATDGQVWAFGLNNMGQLGIGSTDSSTTPRKITGLSHVSMISAGEHHTTALTKDGDVFVFGRGDQSQLGLGDGKALHESPQRLSSISTCGVVKVCCGSYQSSAITDTGDLYTWGFGESFQLCNGKSADADTPFLVTGDPVGAMRVLDVGMGGQHTVLLAKSE